MSEDLRIPLSTMAAFTGEEPYVEFVQPTSSCPHCGSLITILDRDAREMGTNFGRWMWKNTHGEFWGGLYEYLTMSEKDRGIDAARLFAIAEERLKAPIVVDIPEEEHGD